MSPIKPMNLTQKLIHSHLVSGVMEPGSEIPLGIDQTLCQDATGTLVMLELEAMGLDRVRTEVSVQYVDHNLLQTDSRNPDDHAFLLSACRRWGIRFSPPGNGISHVVHMQRFGRPGRTLLGSDSHTCAGGALGMLAIGAGGLDVALAMAGRPFTLTAPEVWGVEVRGRLPRWVSAKDVILELLCRHGVRAGRGRVLEFRGPGLKHLGVMDRHVIANMSAELGATASIFPSDEITRAYLERQGRVEDWSPLAAEPGAAYDHHDTVNLTRLVPLIALPSSPGNVVPVREAAGREIHQAYLGSSANPGYRDFAVPARMVRGRTVHPGVSFDVNPSSRSDLVSLIRSGHLADLVRAGARVHQAGCNGCIGMGQAPATGRISLRTTPRNFPGRSGTPEDSVYLCSPETAAASALAGVITDPRDLGLTSHRVAEPRRPPVDDGAVLEPLPPHEAAGVALVKGPNIDRIPDPDPLPDTILLPVLLAVGDDVSTDEILPAGARALPFRSNIPRISAFAFEGVDPGYAARAGEEPRGHAIVAGHNYGQGSSREHAALALRYLGLRVVLARSFARIHRRNLINFGVLPLGLNGGDGGEVPVAGDVLRLEGVTGCLERGEKIRLRNETRGGAVDVDGTFTADEREILAAGGLLALAAAAS